MVGRYMRLVIGSVASWMRLVAWTMPPFAPIAILNIYDWGPWIGVVGSVAMGALVAPAVIRVRQVRRVRTAGALADALHSVTGSVSAELVVEREAWLPPVRITPDPETVLVDSRRILSPSGGADFEACVAELCHVASRSDLTTPYEVFTDVAAAALWAGEACLRRVAADAGEARPGDAGAAFGVMLVPGLPYTVTVGVLAIASTNDYVEQDGIVVRLQVRPGGAVWRLTLCRLPEDIRVSVALQEAGSAIDEPAPAAVIVLPHRRARDWRLAMAYGFLALTLGEVILDTIAPRLASDGLAVLTVACNLAMLIFAVGTYHGSGPDDSRRSHETNSKAPPPR
jgi:hypothetical protein